MISKLNWGNFVKHDCMVFVNNIDFRYLTLYTVTPKPLFYFFCSLFWENCFNLKENLGKNKNYLSFKQGLNFVNFDFDRFD